MSSPGREEQYDRKTHLTGDQDLPDTAGTRRDPIASVSDRRSNVDTPGANGRQGSEKQAGQQRHTQGEAEDTAVDCKAAKGKKFIRHKAPDGVKDTGSKNQAERGSDQCEKKSLNPKLAKDSGTSSSQSKTGGDLRCAAIDAHQG